MIGLVICVLLCLYCVQGFTFHYGIPRISYLSNGVASKRHSSILLSSIKDQLAVDMKNAMKLKEKLKLSTIRSMQVAIKQKEIDDRVEVSDEVAVGLFSKLIKQRKESMKSYIDGGRADLAEIEKQECEVIASYLPQQLSEEEVDALVTSAIAKLEATTVKDMGKVMTELKPQLSGKVDMSVVGNKIKERLGGTGKK